MGMQVGFIGTGNMGRILIEAFIRARALKPGQIHASNRTFAKAVDLAKTYPGLNVYPGNGRVAQKSDLLFLCVKPLEYKTVIEEIAQNIREEQIVISITSPVSIADLESRLKGKIAKVIPSITNQVGKGVTLLMAGSRLKSREKEQLFSLLSKISQPIWLEEKYTRVASDITSCGPAFISFLMERMACAAEEVTGLPQPQALTLITHMLAGTAALLENNMSLETLRQMVTVPGGVTAVGLAVLDEETKTLFHKLFKATHQKFDQDVQKVYELFQG